MKRQDLHSTVEKCYYVSLVENGKGLYCIKDFLVFLTCFNLEPSNIYFDQSSFPSPFIPAGRKKMKFFGEILH